ncbi:Gfo/Idh/MocA family oxidoreductase [Oleispirillum naphthae]|uniref:Gfo/Idh/MocA family oxidoreductase n=1 Tax=Oleispirillum naphthae TaxID=2838853 RepID=UPI00308263BD
MLLIIGAGEIGREYAKTVRHLGIGDVDILSRRADPAEALRREFGFHRAFGGDFARLPEIIGRYDRIIVAAPVDTLSRYLTSLAELTRAPVLVEKPAALTAAELAAHIDCHPQQNAMVALNRLFYPSVLTLRQRLSDDPVLSADFSFTEWLHRIDLTRYASPVLARWGIANSIHVLSTVFDIIGHPVTLHAEVSGAGRIAWHPSGTVFAGSGRSEAGILFSYASNWISAGRWSAAFRTEKGSYHLEPFEGLSFCPKGRIDREEIEPVWGGELKCGFEGMVRGWLSGEKIDERFGLPQMLRHLTTAERIIYPDKP